MSYNFVGTAPIFNTNTLGYIGTFQGTYNIDYVGTSYVGFLSSFSLPSDGVYNVICNIKWNNIPQTNGCVYTFSLSNNPFDISNFASGGNLNGSGGSSMCLQVNGFFNKYYGQSPTTYINFICSSEFSSSFDVTVNWMRIG